MLVSSMHSRPAMQGRSADALKDVLRAAGRTFPAPAKSPPSAVDTTALRHVLGELNAAHLFLPAPADAHIAPLSPGEARALCAPSRIRYLSIEDTQPNYSIGVFLIPRGARIPLHDHIGMTVVSKLLYGTMEVSSFTLRADPAAAQDDGGLVLREATQLLCAPADAQELTPSLQNVHEIWACSDCAMLDVIGPPYQEPMRRCQYYALEVEPGTGVERLVPIEQPDDFSCRTLRMPACEARVAELVAELELEQLSDSEARR